MMIDSLPRHSLGGSIPDSTPLEREEIHDRFSPHTYSTFLDDSITNLQQETKLLQASECDVLENISCVDAKALSRLNAVTQARANAEKAIAEIDRTILDVKNSISQIDAAMVTKRMTVTKLLNGERNATNDMRISNEEMKKEIEVMDVRIRLGLHEINRRSLNLF
jgi:hypothetical protein